jgi:DNA-binding Lrp family transcriptional regulator
VGWEGRVQEDLDLKILRTISEDARASYRDIARKLNIAVGTVHARIEKLKDNGTLLGFAPILNWSNVGYPLAAVILVRVKGKHLVKVENRLAKLPEVVLLYDITGDFDVAMIAKFRDTQDLNRFVKDVLAMEYIERTSTSIVLNVVKENFLLKF